MIDEYKEQLFEIITRRLIDNEMRSLSSEFMRYVAGGIIKYSKLNLKYVEYQKFTFSDRTMEINSQLHLERKL